MNLMNGVAIVDMDVVVLWWNQTGLCRGRECRLPVFYLVDSEVLAIGIL